MTPIFTKTIQLRESFHREVDVHLNIDFITPDSFCVHWICTLDLESKSDTVGYSRHIEKQGNEEN